MTKILEVSGVGQLHELLNNIHDWVFDLDDFLRQEGIDRSMDLRPSAQDFSKSRRAQRRLLEIRGVQQVIVRDTEEIGCYGIDEVFFSNGVLEFATDVPLTLRINVDGLHLILYDASEPAPARPT